MDLTVLTSLLAARQGATREAISLSVIKNQHELEMSMIDMLTEAIKSAPQPGHGTLIDKIV